MRVSEDDAVKHVKYLTDLDAFYFWNPARGGIAVIIKENGEKLAATSSVSFNKHKEAFIAGKRN